jgi:hypothetical protein
MGFVIVVVGAAYLLISIGVVAWAISHAKKAGKSAKKWGWGAALVMWLIPFWDWIPTVAVHQFYCSTESGFWVYKTLDQWKRENPGVMEMLVADGVTSKRIGNDANHIDTFILNQRFQQSIEKRRLIFLFPLDRWQFELVDRKNHEVIARQVDFSSGEGRDDLKFWRNDTYCSNGRENNIQSSKFLDEFKGARN